MTIKQLREQRAAKATEARKLLEENTGDSWTDEISAKVEEIYAEIERIDAKIELLEKQARIDAEAGADEAGQEAHARAEAEATPEQRERMGAYNKAFKNFLVYGERGISSEEAKILHTGIQAAQSGQQSNGSQGGYLVPTGWGGQLLEALKSFGGMRDVARIIQTSNGNPIPWPTVDETNEEGEIVPENTAATSQDITFGTTQIGAYKYSSKVFTVPLELLMDQGEGVDIEAFIRRSAATRIARIQNRYHTTGSGTNQPLGQVTAAVAGKIGATGQATDVEFDDLTDLEHSIDPAYRMMPGVGWMFHDTTLRSLKKKKDADNRPIWVPGHTTKEPDTINGYGYTINQDMPVMAADARSILFGKLDEYLIRDVMEVTLFRFDDSPFVTKGQIGFLAWARADGRPITAGQPVKFYQNSTS